MTLWKGDLRICSFSHNVGNSNAYWDFNAIGLHIIPSISHILLTQLQAGFDFHSSTESAIQWLPHVNPK